jgi:small ligand-binding sensory domain FIST
MTIRTASGLSTAFDAAVAAKEASAIAREGIGGAQPDLAVVFVSSAFAPDAAEISAAVRETLAPGALIGATAEAIIAGARELEEEPGVSVWAALLPDAVIQTFTVELVHADEGATFAGLPDADGDTGVLLLADPFSFPVDALLRLLNEERPDLTVIGGMASGGVSPGSSRLWWDAEVRSSGAVGVVLRGGVKVRALVSQGCRPIGHPATVTRSERNIIQELAGKPPVELIRDIYLTASVEEQEMMRSGLHVGRVVDEYKSEFVRGDFLIRGVMGADEDTGSVAIGDLVEVGETVQFHVRDAESAHEDLRHMLDSVDPPAGALLFTCNGRGSRLFSAPDHDAALTSATLGVPLGGMFCAGEIGPVGGKNFLHGFTASLALFYEE